VNKTEAKVTDVKKTEVKVRVANSSDSNKLLSDAMQENNGGKSMLGDGTRQNQGEYMLGK